MMISIRQVKEKIKSLLQDEIDRESITDWAVEKCRLDDDRNLEYEVREHEDIIWEALMFLRAADFKVSSTEYFHIMEEFEELLEKLEEVEE
jgi:hypothetical protein